MSEKTMNDGENSSAIGLFISDSNQSILKELIELKNFTHHILQNIYHLLIWSKDCKIE